MERLRQFRERRRTDPAFRAAVSLRLSFGVHLLYVLYKGTAAVWYRSPWFGATAVYYLALSAAQFFLLRQFRPARSGPLHGWRTYRACGFFLLALTVSIAAVNFYTIRDQRAMVYPWHLIYGAAAYTFYSLTLALVRLIRCRRQADPIRGAGALLSLSAALVALFSLQMALLAAFGDGAAWEQLMNTATGSGIFLLVVLLAVRMIRRGGRELRQLKRP